MNIKIFIKKEVKNQNSQPNAMINLFLNNNNFNEIGNGNNNNKIVEPIAVYTI